MVIALAAGLLAPAAPVGAATTPTGALVGGDGGTFTTTLVPSTNAFPTGTGARRAVARDCGLSTPLPGQRSLWLFCDTAVYSNISGTAPNLSGDLRFVGSGTAALAPIQTDPSPSAPLALTEAAYPDQPTQLLSSSGRYGTARTPISCRNGAAAVAWTSGLVTLPGTSRVVAFFQDHCPDIESGFAEYDVGVAEIDLPDVPDGDLSGAATLRVSSRHDSVLVNPTPGSRSKFGHRQGAVVDGEHIYLYEATPAQLDCTSTCRLVTPGRVTVARVPWANGEYRDGASYRYYTGVGADPWSTSRAAAVDVMPDQGWPAGDGLSVAWSPQIRRYVMAHAGTSLGWQDALALRTAPTPWGPWTAPVTLAPSTGSSFANPSGGCGEPTPCRTAYLHPELTGPSGRLHVSYVREGDFATASGQQVRFNGDPTPMQVRLTSIALDDLPRPSSGGVVPGAPTAITATAGDARATVSWTAPSVGSGILGYEITPYVAGVAQAPQYSTSTATTRVVRGLANGVSHTFKVRALNAVGVGSASAASAAVIPKGAPRAPSKVIAEARDASVALSWTAPSSNGGSAITGYEVTPYVDGVAQAPRILSSTATAKVISNLANGTTYTFRIAARNALGLSGGSAPSTAVTPRGLPGAPTAITVEPGNQQVLLSWAAPASTGGSPITGYVVTPSIGGVAQEPRVLVSTATSKFISSLRNGTTYTFKVAAVNAVGTGASSVASAAVTPRTLPDPPTVTGAVPSDRAATVSWAAPPDGGSPIIGYRITPYVGPTTLTPIDVGAVTTAKVTGLVNGTLHRFAVQARTAAGLGLSSGFSDAVAPRTTAGAPTKVTGVPGNGQVTVSWVAPTSDGGAAVSGYRVTPYVGSTALPSRELSLPGTSIIMTGLANGTAHTFKVAALNAAGAGVASAASAAITPRTVPDAPSAVVATASGAGQVTVSWRAPTWTGGAPITSSQVLPFLGGVAQSGVEATGTSTVVKGLVPGLSYRFAVRSANAAGLGASSGFSEPVTVSGTGPTADPWEPFTSWSDLVDQVHLDVLGRPPTAAERATWVTRLQGRMATPGDLVAELRTSTDHTTNIDPVVRLYRAYFLRIPDQAGLDHWVDERRSGRGLSAISSAFSGSREFTARYGSLSDAEFMDLVYRQVLERAPDATGYAFWVDELRSGRRTRGGVMVGFSEASEYRARYGSFVDATVVHALLLGRPPTPTEMAAWRQRSSAGSAVAALAEDIIDSPEYDARVG